MDGHGRMTDGAAQPRAQLNQSGSGNAGVVCHRPRDAFTADRLADGGASCRPQMPRRRRRFPRERAPSRQMTPALAGGGRPPRLRADKASATSQRKHRRLFASRQTATEETRKCHLKPNAVGAAHLVVVVVVVARDRSAVCLKGPRPEPATGPFVSTRFLTRH